MLNVSPGLFLLLVEFRCKISLIVLSITILYIVMLDVMSINCSYFTRISRVQ